MDDHITLVTAKLQTWLTDQALPLWIERGLDQAHGGHYEGLSGNGQTDTHSNIRTRVQARQAFVHAYAYCRGWSNASKPIAQQLHTFIESKVRNPFTSDGYTHLMDEHFNIIDARQDLYDHAFFLLAHAWLYRALDDKRIPTIAENLTHYLDQQFQATNGGWLEGNYDAPRRQNPHMHLFEAFMSLYQSTYNEKWLARAGEIFTLFRCHFFDSKHHTIIEYFTDDWRASSTNQDIEPGHLFEWVWLLRWYEQLSGHSTERYARALYQTACKYGLDNVGLVYDKVNIHTRDRNMGSKRCWPLTEYIKANLAEAKQGYSECEARAADAVENLIKYFLTSSTPGCYIDQLGGDNTIINNKAPASTLYHITVACGELESYCAWKSKVQHMQSHI